MDGESHLRGPSATPATGTPPAQAIPQAKTAHRVRRRWSIPFLQCAEKRKMERPRKLLKREWTRERGGADGRWVCVRGGVHHAAPPPPFRRVSTARMGDAALSFVNRCSEGLQWPVFFLLVFGLLGDLSQASAAVSLRGSMYANSCGAIRGDDVPHFVRQGRHGMFVQLPAHSRTPEGMSALVEAGSCRCSSYGEGRDH